MPTLTISEFAGQALNSRSGLAPVAQLPSLGSSTVAIAGVSAQSLNLQAATTLVRVATDVDCRILSGANPTALATSLPLSAGQSEYFGVPAGGALKIAVIAA